MKLTCRNRHWAAALTLIVLAACSNGRGSVSDPDGGPVEGSPPPAPQTQPPTQPPPEPPPTQPPTQPPPTPPAEPSAAALAGYWKGTAIDKRSDRTYDAVALIDAQGNAQWLIQRRGLFQDDGFVLFGNVCCEAQFSDDVTGKSMAETRTRDARIDAELAEGVLGGKLEFSDDDYVFTLNPSADYDRSLSLAALAGTYTRSTNTIFGEEVTLTVTIQASGELTGSYSNGCVFNGAASIPDTAHNMVQLQIDLANCGSQGSSKQWNGAYTGLGVLLSGDEVFYHSVIGPTWLGPQTVER